MARINIAPPDKILFSTDIPVRITDINYGNHLGNDALLSIIHEARMRFLKSLEYSELDIEGFGLIMTDVIISYRAQSFYGDNLLIEIGINDQSRTSVDIHYSIKCEHRNKIIALAKTGMTFFDYKRQKPVAVPECFINKIQ